MHNYPKILLMLMAEDDEDDRMMAQEVLDESELESEIRFVENGQELFDYLRREGRYREPETSPRPGIILLDLNMPRVDGWEALGELKSTEEFRRIPIVVLTTSREEQDVARAYELGANSYIVKPATFDGLGQVMTNLCRYWLHTVKLSPR